MYSDTGRFQVLDILTLRLSIANRPAERPFGTIPIVL